MLLDHGAESEPARSARRRRSTPSRGCASPAPTAPPASATRRVGTPQQTGKVTAIQLARKLLENGANPNTRVEWNEPRFGKEGGTARNPPNIRLGRHLLSYSGATPFYVAAKNGDVAADAAARRVHGATRRSPTLTGITPLMVAAGLDYLGGRDARPVHRRHRGGAARGGEAGRRRWATTSTRARTSATTRWRATSTTRCSTTRTTSTSCVDLGVGDPRWNGSTPLIGAIMSNQPSIVQYLVDQGADVQREDDARAGRRCNVAEGVFCCNAKKEFPAAAAIIRKALGEPAR